jgi:Holliday junction resolvase
MPNRNYTAGRRFEYQVQHEHELKGFLVIRAAGSHGPADLVCLGEGGTTLLVQCKVVTTKAAAERLIHTFKLDKRLRGHHFMLAVKVKGNSDYTQHYI